MNTPLIKDTTQDAKSPVASCPQRQAKVQLLPIRYAIVEQDLYKRAQEKKSTNAITDLSNLTSSAPKPPLKNTTGGKPYPISSPRQLTYDLKSRPVGTRLLRDGYLYIYEKTGLFYEYKLKDGLPEQLLWAHTKLPDADKRTVDQKQDLKLLFNRTSTIYVCYSEIQWTMAKCKQIMGSPTECDAKMQKVNLSAVDCQQGGIHLLTKAQYEAFQSELNDDKLLITQELNQLKTDQTITEQSPLLKSYVWEENHSVAKGKANAQKLQQLVDPKYQDDHLYLVIRDDIGMLRDLAEYQDAIINLRKDWFSKEEIQYKYVVGSYIQSLYTLEQNGLYQLSSKTKEYEDFRKEITPEQNKKILEYIRIHNVEDYRSYDHWLEQVFLYVRSLGIVGKSDYDYWAEDLERARKEMEIALGHEKYEKYKVFIDAIDQQTGNALVGNGLGAVGIQDFIKRSDMEDFLSKQQRYLGYMNTLIHQINEDRRLLFNRQAFFLSAWYYCAKSSDQTLLFGKAHYEVYKDLGLTEEALTDIGNMLEKEALIHYPILYTLPAPDQYDAKAKISAMLKAGRDILFLKKDFSDLETLSKQVGTFVSDKAPYALDLTGEFGRVVNITNTTYNPAIQKQIANTILEIKAQLKVDLSNIDDILRSHYPKGRIAQILTHYHKSGVQLKFSTAADMQTFKNHVDEVKRLRAQRRMHKDAYHKFKAEAKRPYTESQVLNKKADAELAAYKALDPDLEFHEKALANKISLDSSSKKGIGISIDGLTPEQLTEVKNLQADHLNKANPTGKAIKASAFKIAGGDFWSLLMVAFEIKGLYSTLATTFTKKGKLENTDMIALGKAFASFFSASFGAAQTISAGIVTLHLETWKSTAGKITGVMRYGALIEVFGLIGYGFGVANAYFNISDRYSKLLNARDNDNILGITGATMALVGAGGQGAINLTGSVRSLAVITKILADYGVKNFTRGMLTAGAAARGVSYLARFSLITLGFTALEFLGEWIYNHNNLTRLDKWLQKSIWTSDPQARAFKSLEDEDLALNYIIAEPIVDTLTLDQEMGERTQRVRITFPSIRTSDIDDVPISIGAGMIIRDKNPNFYKYFDYNDFFINQLHIISNVDEALTLAFDVNAKTSVNINKTTKFYIMIEYPVTITPKQVVTTTNYDIDIDISHPKISKGSVARFETTEYESRNAIYQQKRKPTLRRITSEAVSIGDPLDKRLKTQAKS